MAWPGDRVQQMVIARLSLNNPYNNMTLLEGFFRKMTEIERERDRKKEIQKERKKERKKERQKERRKDRKKKERKKERKKKTNKERKKKKEKKERKKNEETKREREQASWMPNDMVQELQETRHDRLNFPYRFCPLGECAQQYLLGYGPRLSLLGRPYRLTVFRAHRKKLLQY